MRVFKLFFKIEKSLWKTLLIYFAIMLAFIIGFRAQSRQLGEGDHALYVGEIRLAVIDQDHTKVSQALSAMYKRSNKWVDAPADKQGIKDALYNDELDGVVLIPKGFSQDFMKNSRPQVRFYGGREEIVQIIVQSQTNRFLRVLSIYRQVLNEELEGENLDYVLAEAEKITQPMNLGELLPEKKSADPELAAYLQCLKTSDYVLLMTSFFAVGMAICFMDRPAVKNRTAVSGSNQASMTVQIFLSAFLSVFCFWIFLVLVITGSCGGFSMWGRPIIRWALLTNFVHMLTIGGVVLFFSYLFLNENAISFLQVIVPLAAAFSTGIFIPREFMSPGILKASRFIPTHWDVKAISDALNDPSMGPEQIANFQHSIRIMLIMLVIIFFLTLLARTAQMRKAEKKLQ